MRLNPHCRRNTGFPRCERAGKAWSRPVESAPAGELRTQGLSVRRLCDTRSQRGKERGESRFLRGCNLILENFDGAFQLDSPGAFHQHNVAGLNVLRAPLACGKSVWQEN